MANLKEVRNRIVSVSSTQQITSAMKMVSAAKLRKAQDAVTQIRPYTSKLKELLPDYDFDQFSGKFEAGDSEIKKDNAVQDENVSW